MVSGPFEELVGKPFHVVCSKEQNTEHYTAIDARSTAARGKCLVVFANYASGGCYMFHGGSSGEPQPNIEISLNAFGVFAYARAIKNINVGDEMYLALPSKLSKLTATQLLIPSNAEMEASLNLNPADFVIPELPDAPRCLEILFSGLTHEETARAQEFIANAETLPKSTSMHILEADCLNISAGSFVRFRPLEWADDIMVDAWSTLLRETDKKMRFHNPYRKHALIFNTCLDIFHRIQNEEWDKLNRLFRSDRIEQNLSFLDYDRLMIPLNHSNTHWTLMVAYLDKKTVVYMDSLHSVKPPKDKDPKMLLHFLRIFADIDNRPFDISEWNFVSVKPLKQVNIIHSLYFMLFQQRYLLLSTMLLID